MSLLATILPVIGTVIDRVFPDKTKAAELQQAITLEMIKNTHELEKAAGEIIKAEAASSHWLAANWRPITMLTFVGLIVARWFGYAAPQLSEAEYLALWDIVQIGLGGYTITRSIEKIAPVIADGMKKRK